ncbi:MAG: V-type ATP synthase subunit D [Firmicutes bacterium]|nr:V-type ATP synthase subunit D [Bacillota bacterium]
MEIRVNPTRMELLRLRRRLAMDRRGHKLLKDKLDEMMKRFRALVEENRRLRTVVEEALAEATGAFVMARALMGEAATELAIAVPVVRVRVEAGARRIMNVLVPTFAAVREEKADTFPYGFAETSGELDVAITLLRETLEELVRLVEAEKAVELLAAEIERTRRRVNALEYVLIPRLEEKVRFISMKLDENERATRTRLMKIKSLVERIGEG